MKTNLKWKLKENQIKPQHIKLVMAEIIEVNREGITTKQTGGWIEATGILASSSAQLQHVH